MIIYQLSHINYHISHMPTSLYNHKHDTRLSTGVLKRKYIIEKSITDCPTDSESEYESDNDSFIDDSNDPFVNKSTKSLAKDKLKYNKFICALYPSKYSASKINKLKRINKPKPIKLPPIPKIGKNKRYLTGTDNADTHNDDDYVFTYDDDDVSDTDDKETRLDKPINSKTNNIIEDLVKLANNDLQNEIIVADDDDDNDGDMEKFATSFAKTVNKNYKAFTKILAVENNESLYFKKHMSPEEQDVAIEKLTAIKKLTSVETPYLIHLVNIDIPDTYKACALRKINALRTMEHDNGEYYKVKSWVDAFIKLPFNKYNNLPITFADGIDECHSFMKSAKNTLDSVVYGLEDAKMQIMQLIGLWLVNPNAVGSAIAIKGPMGTGKTTLIKDGISKILNRPFALVALGGCGDSGFLDGYAYTFEGSKYGKIIDILIQSGCMNPVILFDELDKISDTPKGEEIAGVLTHLTDTTQNTDFSDKYLSEISLDMSRALYIFSYNDETKVNTILKDRMYKIETKGYTTKDKLVICKNYLLTKIQEQTKFSPDDIVFTDEIIKYIITDFTEQEAGVRNLKGCVEIIYTKLNLYRLMKSDDNLFQSSLKLDDKVEFPFHLKRNTIDKLLTRTEKNDLPLGMYN
jgi:ATP-dependent Lon protease